MEESTALSLCILYLPNAMDFTFYCNWFPVVSTVSSKMTITPPTNIDIWPFRLSLYFTFVSVLRAIYSATMLSVKAHITHHLLYPDSNMTISRFPPTHTSLE